MYSRSHAVRQCADIRPPSLLRSQPPSRGGLDPSAAFAARNDSFTKRLKSQPFPANSPPRTGLQAKRWEDEHVETFPGRSGNKAISAINFKSYRFSCWCVFPLSCYSILRGQSPPSLTQPVPRCGITLTAFGVPSVLQKAFDSISRVLDPSAAFAAFFRTLPPFLIYYR